jgi:hypothetical protein
MSWRISIHTGPIILEAELIDNATSRAIWKALPIKSSINTWGHEIYFSIPVSIGPENGREVVDTGDIAYWPPGKAFCIFFGPTPASRGSEIRAASAVNVFGKIIGDPKVLSNARDGDEVSVSRVP